MNRKISRRDVFKDSALMLGGLIIVAPVLKAYAQTAPTLPRTPNPVEGPTASQDPAQNRTADQLKRDKDQDERDPGLHQRAPKGSRAKGSSQRKHSP